MSITLLPPRSLLYVPAHRARAVARAATLPAELVILDLEDAVPPDAKADARAAILALVGPVAEPATAPAFLNRLAIRINAVDSPDHDADLRMLDAAPAGPVVVPKVEHQSEVEAVTRRTGRPVIAMIESAAGILAAPDIARVSAGLMLGANDLAVDLGLPPETNMGLAFSRQSLVIAARAARVPVFDGVFNRLDDADGFLAECRSARALGFDGKSLIHPDQVAPANLAFAPSAAEVEDARALVAAAAEGAVRFRDRMVEALHVEAARRLLMRADAEC